MPKLCPNIRFPHQQDFFPIRSVTKSSTSRFSHENLVEKFRIFVQDFVPIRTALTCTVFLYGNWDVILFTVMYHTVTSNHGNLAFCTVIFCTVMVNVLYYGNGRHGVGKGGLSR